MDTTQHVAWHDVVETPVDGPLSLLIAFVGLALLLEPHVARWWKKRRDARRK